MKIECSCGAKYEFEVRPEMREHPIAFVCPSCGLDASAFVDGLVRRELGQATSPVGERIPIVVQSPAETLPSIVPAETSSSANPSVLCVRQPQASQDSGTGQDAPLCLRHPGEVASSKC